MYSPEFHSWRSTPRLFRDIVITEKIDGTNACIIVKKHTFGEGAALNEETSALWTYFVLSEEIDEGTQLPKYEYWVAAQSRNRIITPGADNAGFAKWVQSNARTLVSVLGEGYHYGEWWGSGIQRGYGLTKGEKRFSLFNPYLWADTDFSAIPELGVVPLLYEGLFNEAAIHETMNTLKEKGSYAAPGFMNPEGIVVYHSAAKMNFKATFDNDQGKWSI